MTGNAAQAPFKLNTTRFGEIQVDPGKVVTLPHGMIGFPNQRRFVLVHHKEGSPFHWLQSIEQADLAFVVVAPMLFDPQYQVALGGAETKILQVTDPKDIQVWVVVTIPQGQPDQITANLKAPVVINLDKRLGAQVILDDPKYGVKHPLPKAGSQPGGQGQAK
jgi:flagellar assembly factor FliW